MGLRVEAPFQLRSNARLADAGFARNYHDLAVARWARAQRRDRRSISASRPISGVSADPRNAIPAKPAPTRRCP
jgi:hypothetical protein